MLEATPFCIICQRKKDFHMLFTTLQNIEYASAQQKHSNFSYFVLHERFDNGVGWAEPDSSCCDFLLVTLKFCYPNILGKKTLKTRGYVCKTLKTFLKNLSLIKWILTKIQCTVIQQIFKSVVYIRITNFSWQCMIRGPRTIRIRPCGWDR